MRASIASSTRCPIPRRARPERSSTSSATRASTTASRSRAACWRRSAGSFSRSSSDRGGDSRPGRGGRAAEGARLESAYTEGYRGFESLALRHHLRLCASKLLSLAPMTTSTISAHAPARGLLVVALVALAVPQGAIDPEAANFPYPFPVRFFPVTVERQEVRIAFMDVPPTGRANGRTAVLLHGKNFSGAYWEPTIRPLAAEGFRVVVPDQIGFGRSTKP